MMTARFHCVFIMLVQCILYTKFGLFHRSTAYGSYLWVPDALLPIDFSMYIFDKAESDIFNGVKSRGRGRVPSRVPGGARAGLRGTPHFCCKNKEGGTKGAPLGWSTD